MTQLARSRGANAQATSAEIEALQSVIEALTSALHELDKSGHSMASIHLNSAIEILRADEANLAAKVHTQA